MSLSGKQFGLMIAITLVSAVVLAETYFLVSDLGLSAWVAAAVVNSVFALVAGWFFFKDKLDGEMLTAKFKKSAAWAFLPAAVVLGLTVCAATVTYLATDNSRQETLGTDLWLKVAGWALWIPVVEELVFRVGFGGVFRKIGGVFWGSYFSIALFSFMHTLPTMDRIMAGQVGFTAGTLLLAVMCEGLWVYTRNLWGIICLHAACNFTVVIFTYLDARWLHWLSPLYL